MKTILALLTSLLLCPALAAQRFEKDGVVVQFSIRTLTGKAATEKTESESLREGSSAILSLTLSDSRTRRPITSLHPSAWISTRTTEPPLETAQCADLIRALLSGSSKSHAELDLNTYELLTLNDDHSVAFIRVSGSDQKLERYVTLTDNGADLVLGPTKEFLYVTVPGQPSVAVIDTFSARVFATIPLAQDSKPQRMAIQPDGRYIWIALDGAAGVAVIDTANNRLVTEIPTGAGTHRFAFMPDSTRVFITNSAADTVSIVDTKSLTKAADVNISKSPAAIAYSPASNSVYVAAGGAGLVSVIDPITQKIRASIPSKPGIVDLQFAPGGQFGFVINQSDNTLSVFDAVSGKIVATTAVAQSPDQIAFTRDYAYVRSTSSENLALFALSKLATGKLESVSIPAGLKAPNQSPADIGLAGMIAPSPEGNSVFIANAADQVIYYYFEGMAAPMGTFSNYKRRPHGVRVLDRSLTEVAPGEYSTMIRLPRSGRYDVPFLLDQPRLITCFTFEVRASREQAKNHETVGEP